ncbi:MAG: ParB/RepB/Spo0J family partition protein, partial [Lachnospiraceae bacterium]|nr:ParB/RepB/Spo0J family partition protein [Lachnospiraceae bacterium]
SISDLHEFDNHPFNVITDSDDFNELVESIKENGVIYPILVRPQDDKYEIISGHRRVAACKAAGLTEVPAIIRPMDDYEATVLMVHTNLYRPEISIMERAKAYRMCHDAEKHQGKKFGGDTAERLGAEASDSRRKVYRYIRLSYLNDYLLSGVSEKRLTINIGIELSYLDEASQAILQEVIEEYSILPNIEQATLLGELGKKSETISKEKIIAIILGEEKKKAVKNSISFKKKDIESYFEPETAPERMSEIIVQLLQKYKEGVFSEYFD